MVFSLRKKSVILCPPSTPKTSVLLLKLTSIYEKLFCRARSRAADQGLEDSLCHLSCVLRYTDPKVTAEFPKSVQVLSHYRVHPQSWDRQKLFFLPNSYLDAKTLDCIFVILSV